MPPRNRNHQVISSPEPEDQPSAPDPMPAPPPANRETFNLDNMSGSEDAIHINNPDKTAKEDAWIKSSADIEHFFDKAEDKTVCKKCQ
jgi:hypothetical protein